MNTLFSLLFVLVILSAGCASKHPTVSARRNGGYAPARTDKIAFTVQPNPRAESAELGRLLTAELKTEGFQLVPAAAADYLLAYALEDDATETYLPQHDFVVQNPSQTSEYILAAGTPAQPGFVRPRERFDTAQSIGPTVVVYHNFGIRLYLYTNPQTHAGKLDIAWSGFIESGKKIPANRELTLIEALLEHFGQDYVGRVNLAK
jgi:hypothetical protein